MTDAEGTPIWFELTTPDQAAARAFYAALAGWTITTSPMAEHGGYAVAAAPGGAEVAGMMTPPPGMEPPPGWTVYFSTRDVDATAARVSALGGTLAFGPMIIPHVGRFAVVADPQGVVFALMTRSDGQPSRAFSPTGGTPGHAVWVEIATPDPDAAWSFYGALFGWTREGAMPMGDMGEYGFIGAGELRPGAVMSSTATGAPARWNWYIEVPDIDAAITRAQGAGGTLMQGPDEIPGGQFSANLADPAGQQIGLVGPRQEASA